MMTVIGNTTMRVLIYSFKTLGTVVATSALLGWFQNGCNKLVNIKEQGRSGAAVLLLQMHWLLICGCRLKRKH